MQRTQATNNEADILGRLLEPEKLTFSREMAEALLRLDFGQEDKERMNALAAKARAGMLTAEEQAEIDAYSRIGSLVSILKSKARVSLKGRRSSRATSHG